ncbi:tail fiber protein [Dokdonia sp.]|uniref:phage tail protein n=1 Tax=Dokdonia sp. TaxID=2024995 RepID=UPI003264D21D
MDPFLAEITMFGGNFAPRGWAFCNGQLLPINQNSALFSLLGTTYGGDGRTTFALPDLRGRVAIHPGHGPGLSNYSLGERGGKEAEILTVANLPSHNHGVSISVADDANTDDPEGAFLGAGTTIYNTAKTGNNTLAGAASLNTGSNQAFSILQPFNTVNYIIALQGVFPSRN